MLETWHLPGMGVGGGARVPLGGLVRVTPTFPPCPTRVGWGVVAVGGGPGAVGLSWAAAQVYSVVTATAASESLCPGPATSAGSAPCPLEFQGSPPALGPLQRALPQPAQPSECGESVNRARCERPGLGRSARSCGREVANSEQKASRVVRGSHSRPRLHKSRLGTTAAESAL